MCASPGTPRKKRKMEQTWETLVRGLPEELTQDLQRLPSLLDTVGSLAVFQLYPEFIQKWSLVHVLGENSPLVEAIMKRIMETDTARDSYAVRALNCDLAPSSELTDDTVVSVLNAILRVNFIETSQLCDYFTSFLSTSTEPVSAKCSKMVEDITKMVTVHWNHTLYVGQKEASGRVILGLFMEGVREALHNIYPNKVLKVDHEFKILPGKQFATDEAVAVVVVVRGTGVEVVYAIDYKPRVSLELHDQNPSHICEMFLQAFYLSTQCDHDILHCLTDLKDYHMFLIGKEESTKKFCIKKYWYRKCDLTNSGEAAEHLSFLSEIIVLPSIL